MIERKFVAQKLKEKQIQEYISSFLTGSGNTRIEIKKTPLGEKIIVYTSKPGLIVGRKGENIKHITKILKDDFKLENPQIEIGEIDNPMLDPYFVLDNIIGAFERFGSKRFKFMGYDSLKKIMDAGAIGAEIVISGTVPSSRAKSWRFSAGYLKKSGDVSESHVLRAKGCAKLKRGVLGVKVTILPPDIYMPDRIELKVDKEKSVKVEEESSNKKVEKNEESKEEKKPVKEKRVKKKSTKKKVVKKKSTKKEKNGNNKKE